MNELKIIYDELKKLYINDTTQEFILSKEDYINFLSLFEAAIKTSFNHLEYLIPNLEQIFSLDIKIEYNINFNNNILLPTIKPKINCNQIFIKCEDRDAFFDNNYMNIDINLLSVVEHQIYKQYDYLFRLPQPVQKSKEWFDMRNNMITASNCGTVIGECKHSTIKDLLIDKIGLGEKFKENKFVYHGKKYEKIAIMIYENIYNSKVGEFGLIRHPTISYLGASPDGISMSLTQDGSINKLLGRMLEIKCPPSRKILNCGKIKGDICPDYYWVQVQIQLECCDLPECDFWQCNLIEYDDEDDFLIDDVDDLVHSHNNIYKQDTLTIVEIPPTQIYIDKRIRKGAIIELHPRNRSIVPKGEQIEWYSKYIYPPIILKTETEYKTWTMSTIQNLNILYPELYTDYVYSRVVYWKLKSSHNELITRQPEWFESKKEYYRIFWERVLYYRTHIEHAHLDLINRRIPNNKFLESNIIRIQATTDESIFIKSNLKTKAKQVTKSHLTDEFIISSDSPPTVINSSKPTPKPKQIAKIPIYKNSSNNNSNSDELDLFMISNNLKK